MFVIFWFLFCMNVCSYIGVMTSSSGVMLPLDFTGFPIFYVRSLFVFLIYLLIPYISFFVVDHARSRFLYSVDYFPLSSFMFPYRIVSAYFDHS